MEIDSRLSHSDFEGQTELFGLEHDSLSKLDNASAIHLSLLR
jgi:hypothetical protein